MSSLALSVLLSLVSAVAYAAGAIVQERVAADGDERAYAALRNGVWWGAVALNGVGAVLHVVALAYGPLSLVQPLGALTIVFALPMAALFVRRRAGAAAWRGAVIAAVGLAGLLALTRGAESRTLDGYEQLMLGAVTAGSVAALFLVAKCVRRPVVRSVILAAGAGVSFGIASVFTKAVAVRWASGAVTAGLPTLLAIAALAGAGLLLSQAAYRGAGLTAPLATVTVVNPVIAAVVGLTLFGESFRHGTTGALLALGCGAVAAGGLVLLTTERLGAERRVGEDLSGERVERGSTDREDGEREGVERADGEDKGPPGPPVSLSGAPAPSPAVPTPRKRLPAGPTAPAPSPPNAPVSPSHGESGAGRSPQGPARPGGVPGGRTGSSRAPGRPGARGLQTLTPPARR
ncbi:DMT family transporter [Streptomyces sp. DT24]|uniref:DMT family transporter n=1 Tax=unclassified Streptomyces TaxID=2593676 RepID=UPI0023B88EB8|nr:DMT family transporter [Streptomyces sp. AM 4-1-1]WEH36927.1 DMT family transporter [Streptomyces sp. AM 4-1-1]